MLLNNSFSCQLVYLVEQLHSYASLQVTLSQNITHLFKRIRQNIPSSCLYMEEDPGEAYEAHVTLFYGLQESDVVSVTHLLNNSGSFPLQILGSVAYFQDNEDYDVLYCPVDCESIENIHYKLRSELKKDPPTYKIYQPHCTIAYVNKGYIPVNISLPFSQLTCIISELEFRLKNEAPLGIQL